MNCPFCFKIGSHEEKNHRFSSYEYVNLRNCFLAVEDNNNYELQIYFAQEMTSLSIIYNNKVVIDNGEFGKFENQHVAWKEALLFKEKYLKLIVFE